MPEGRGMSLESVAPVLGCILGNVMWLSPLPAVLAARRNKFLGGLNPYPFAITVLNCIAWMMYAIMLQDYYIFISNFPGLVVGMYYTITALVLLSGGKTSSDVLRYNVMEGMIVVGMLYFGLISLVVGLYLDESQQSLRESIVASTGVACAVMYYVAPCSTIYQVITTRNASTIHAPMMMANAANSFLWLVYGVSIKDPFVYAPNVIGFGLSVLQLLLSLLFKSGGAKGDAMPAPVLGSGSSSRYDVVSQRDDESGIETRQY